MLNRALDVEQQVKSWRQDFHMHPELGFQETRTAARVAEVLEGLGYQVRCGVGKTGVVADRGQGRPVVAVRADMDALPIHEAADRPYASQNPGVMHACGHDAHSAMALGVASILAKETFPGRVRFLFQPSEETDDDEGYSGAPRMVADGAMDGVDAILSLHVDARNPVGTITLVPGPASAGVDTFHARISGRGGHGAAPHLAVDPIYLAGHVVLAIHGIISRRLHPADTAVVTIGSIHGGSVDNVIPEYVDLSGTIRFLTEEVRTQIHAEIERAVGVARSLGGDCQLRITPGCLPMINDVELVNLIRDVAGEILARDHILVPPKKEMGAEDFGSFASLAPGVMFMLGCRIEGDERVAHHPRFDVDERCLPIGVAIMTEAVLRRLRDGAG